MAMYAFAHTNMLECEPAVNVWPNGLDCNQTLTLAQRPSHAAGSQYIRKMIRSRSWPRIAETCIAISSTMTQKAVHVTSYGNYFDILII